MLDSIAEAAPFACPLALSFATVIAADRVRTRRRRELLNRSLHELRRPLQALVLQARSAPGIGAQRRGQLDLALDALAGLDRQVNGGRGSAAVGARRRRGVGARGGRPLASGGGACPGDASSSSWCVPSARLRVRPAGGLAGARQPARERARARPRADPGRGQRARRHGCGSWSQTGPTPARTCRRRGLRERRSRRGAPGAGRAAVTACGSSPTSPPTTAGASPPAPTPRAPARCWSCRWPVAPEPRPG